jgi:biopolymer transport protein ExbD
MKKKARRPRKQGQAAELEMTPMIDVVFQLLIFFLVTLKVEDILSHLDIFRPAPDPNAIPEEQVEDLLTITVYDEGYVLNGRKVKLAGAGGIEGTLMKLGTFSKNVSVVIKCTGNSVHASLVRLLDVCAKAGLRNLSVFSM